MLSPALSLSLFLAALGWAGCAPVSSSNLAPVESRLFSRVEVIGTRGTGPGHFNKPRSVAVDAQDNLYVVDMTGRVQKFSSAGEFLTSWQMPQTDKGRPKGMCRDAAGNLVVIEPHYSRVNHFSPQGKLLAQWGAAGTNTGQLAFPRAAAVNSHGEIYISEYGAVERVQRFSADGKKLLGGFGRPGTGPGEFNRPEGLGVDPADRVLVADSCNHRVQVLSSAGGFLREFGKAGSGRGEMSYPYDVRVDAAGRVFVCEFGNSRIQIFTDRGESLEILGGPGAAPGQMSNPWSIALDAAGNLYVADAGNHRVQKFIRRVERRASSVEGRTCALPSRAFPLTPALSLGERENRRPSTVGSGALGIFADRTWLFPLPEGEGQGERKPNQQLRFLFDDSHNLQTSRVRLPSRRFLEAK